MRIAALADVHANLPALRAVLEDVERIGCDAIWILGDLVGRGPHPNEVIAEVQSRQLTVIQGNWDEAVGMEREHSGALWPDADAEAMGRASLQWTTAVTSEEHRSYLRQLPTMLRLDLEGRSVLLFHGSPVRQSEYLWSDRPSRAFARIAVDHGADLCCFGHTHESFHRVVTASHFVAAGSVGCGTRDDARARYAVIYLTSSELVVGFRSVDYDRAAVVEAMRAAGLSPALLSEGPQRHVPHRPTDSAAAAEGPAT